MNDDDHRINPRDHADGDRYGETLLYDFAKFLTTLSLLLLGGMLTLSTAALLGTGAWHLTEQQKAEQALAYYPQ